MMDYARFETPDDWSAMARVGAVHGRQRPTAPLPIPLRNPHHDNDNKREILIGLTGLRNVGKSTVANMLEQEYGFYKVHAFESGKEAAFTYFAEITGDPEMASEMVYGALKDKPSSVLPGGVPPRFFLEKFGHFMGATLGVEWTLGMELRRVRWLNPSAPIVVESLVYEAPWFKARGGFVVRLSRPGHEGPAGVESDAVQAAVAEDAHISATSVDELLDRARVVVERVMQQKRGGG